MTSILFFLALRVTLVCVFLFGLVSILGNMLISFIFEAFAENDTVYIVNCII